jgi:hypothetical protein
MLIEEIDPIGFEALERARRAANNRPAERVLAIASPPKRARRTKSWLI